MPSYHRAGQVHVFIRLAITNWFLELVSEEVFDKEILGTSQIVASSSSRRHSSFFIRSLITKTNAVISFMSDAKCGVAK